MTPPHVDPEDIADLDDGHWLAADDPRWEPETRSRLMLLEKREKWVLGFRYHLVRTHSTNAVDACGCRTKVPRWMVEP